MRARLVHAGSIIWFLALGAFPTLADEGWPNMEKDAMVSETVSHRQIWGMVEMVKLQGYRCDSVSSASMFFFGGGYTLKCNRYRYEYEIEDHGGKWIVRVID